MNDWAATILHELGHVFYDLYGSAASQIKPDDNTTAAGLAASQDNTHVIKQKCKL